MFVIVFGLYYTIYKRSYSVVFNDSISPLIADSNLDHRCFDMFSHLILPTLFAVTTLCSPVARPEESKPDDSRLELGLDEDETIGRGYSTVRFHCNKEGEAPKVDFKQCNDSLSVFKDHYPPKPHRQDGWTLTHRPHFLPSDNVVFCPVTSNPDPQPGTCDFIFDYTDYIRRGDMVDELGDIKELGESLGRKCLRQNLSYGGRVAASYGSQSLEIKLQARERNRVGQGDQHPGETA